MGPADLEAILKGIRLPAADAAVILGLESPDDAGVYRLSSDMALVQSVDYFTPIVDDPQSWGAIAAANALSDIYAMGARPLTALNLFGFPVDLLRPETLAGILQGGAAKIAEAGCALVGGHTVDDPQPKFGYAVTGIAHPDRLLLKSGARPGDVLFLTKPIGVGVITTAMKEMPFPDRVVEEIVGVMVSLNRVGERLPDLGVRGATDVTGFGLLGHAIEMARESGVRLRIHASEVPVLEAARRPAEEDLFPGGSRKNARHFGPYVTFPAELPDPTRMLFFDAVTSGGLLIAVPSDRARDVAEALRASDALWAETIGEVLEGSPGTVDVVA